MTGRTLGVAGAACLTGLFAWACSDAAAPASGALIWQDEFEGPAGQLPDADKWVFDLGTDWGNAQLEFTTDRASNVSLDGEGNLAITARRERYMDRDYTSGRIKTLGRFQQERGRFEARIKVPVGQGMWPAFWMLGGDFPNIGWPACGEIDIMEFRGQEPNIVHGSLHGPGYSAGQASSTRFVLPGGGFHEDFHTFAVEWSQDRIEWFVDGELYKSVGPDDLTGEWVFDKPFFILLNLAIGGHFVGPPNPDTVFPQSLLVDWVRVWSP